MSTTENLGEPIFNLIDRLEDVSFGEKEKINYIENQTYLWLAKINIDQNKYKTAEHYLITFLEKFPNHKEMNYVRYELGKIYERQQLKDLALAQYGMIRSGMWKSKAAQRTAEIMTNVQ